jgi:hypothetical protein
MAGKQAAYPVTMEIGAPERVANWRPLVHWLLAVPHFIVMSVLGLIADVVVLLSWFAIVFTGKLPQGLAGMQCTYLRYSVRTYAYAGFLVEEYPPFTYSPDGADPGDGHRVRVELRPALTKRNRLTVFFRLLLVLPHLIVLTVFGIGLLLAYVAAFFAVLFTGRWPAGIRAFVVGVLDYSLRVRAYLFLLTDEFPSFGLDK